MLQSHQLCAVPCAAASGCRTAASRRWRSRRWRSVPQLQPLAHPPHLLLPPGNSRQRACRSGRCGSNILQQASRLQCAAATLYQSYACHMLLARSSQSSTQRRVLDPCRICCMQGVRQRQRAWQRTQTIARCCASLAQGQHRSLRCGHPRHTSRQAGARSYRCRAGMTHN